MTAGTAAEPGAPPDVLELTLPAEPTAVGQVRAAVRSFAAAHGLDDDALSAVMLAVSEAVTNAVVHAFVGREPGRVRTVARAGAGELFVLIADDGRGMQPRADSPGMGIGLPTMGQVSRSLDIRPGTGGGTEVRMTFAAPGVRGRATTDAALAEERMRLLMEVDRLAAASGWPDEGVGAMVALLCPAVADVCAVDVVGEGGAPRRLAARVDDDDELSAWLAARPVQERYPGSPTYDALDLTVPQIVEVTEELQLAASADDDDLGVLRRLPVRWWVTLPLREADRTLALLHVGTSEQRGRPTAEDMTFYEVVGERAARGLANTQLIGELRRTRRRLERILGALSEAITVNDADGRMVYANEAAARLLGVGSVDELLRARPGDIAARFRITREDGSPVSIDEMPGRRLVRGDDDAPPLLTRSVHLPTGRERWLLTKASLLDDDGPLAVHIIEDVTESKHAERRQRFLAQAGRLLVGIAGSDMPQRLAEMAVQEIADWCIIDEIDDTGQVARVGLAHRDPAKLAIARENDRRWPPARRPAGAIVEMLRGGPALLVPTLTDDMLARWAQDDEHLERLMQVGLRSVIIAPLRAGSENLGVLHLISAESARSFDDTDRTFACDVAERVGTALRVARRAS